MLSEPAELRTHNLICTENLNIHVEKQLTFKNRASYIQDGRTATLQMLHFIYIFSKKYKYLVF
jgi:hypothetical protein